MAGRGGRGAALLQVSKLTKPCTMDSLASKFFKTFTVNKTPPDVEIFNILYERTRLPPQALRRVSS